MTKVLPVSEHSIQKAAALVKKGAVVAFPTETVYGLGANALDADAVSRIFAAKGRPEDNPLILHVSGAEELTPLVKHVPPEAKLLADAFWPGPLTIVLESADFIPPNVRGGLPTVAIRCPQNEWARRLIAACGFPIAAPSANRSGRPSPTTAAAVLEDMEGRIPLILDGGPCRIGLESTVITLCTVVPRILRPGMVTAEQIENVIGAVEIDSSALKELVDGAPAQSPGMRYRHYAPKAELTVVNGDTQRIVNLICLMYDDALIQNRNPAVLARAENLSQYGNRDVYELGSAGNAESVGAALFEALRRVDADGRTDVFAEAVEPTGFGLAVMNRLLRAAGFNVIDV